MENNLSYSLLTIGKTQESKEATEGFKKYVGLAPCHILAVNPTKKELEEIYGREIQNEPEYTKDSDDGKMAFVTFIVRTDADQCNGIDLIQRVSFTLRNSKNKNSDGTKVQVIDDFGNSTWANLEDAKAGKKLVSSNGKDLKIDTKYRPAIYGEADLVSFLKLYLGVDDAFNYVNDAWVKKENANDYAFILENVKDYFKGDVSEIKEAINLQPNNKVKFLFGVRTNDEGKQYQEVCTRDGFILRNNAGSKALLKLEQELARTKMNGGFSHTEYKIQPLAEYNIEPTNFEETTVEDSSDNSSELPWD